MKNLKLAKEIVIEKIMESNNNLVKLNEKLEEEFNKGKFFSQDRADQIQSDMKKEAAYMDTQYATLNAIETKENEVVTVKKEQTVIEMIAEQLYEQGFYPESSENSLTVEGLTHKVLIEKLENGFAVCTYSTGGIEWLKNYEWANHKVVKTLRGLNGYFRKFGISEVTL